MKELGWKKVAALTEEGHKYADYISAVQDLVEKDGISFVVNRNIPNDAKLSMTQVLFLLQVVESAEAATIPVSRLHSAPPLT
jgi:hypothetical protein